MNRDALRVSARNGCVQPVRGSYGAVSVRRRRRWPSAVRPRSVGLILLLGAGGLLAYFLVSATFEPRPTLRIVSPASDAVVAAATVAVVVDVSGATLSSGGGSSRNLHLHYYLDAEIPSDPTKPAVPTTGAWTSTTRTSHEWTLRGEGLHILAVQLVASDDRPLSPPVMAAVVVRVPRPAATPPASPQPTSPVK